METFYLLTLSRHATPAERSTGSRPLTKDRPTNDSTAVPIFVGPCLTAVSFLEIREIADAWKAFRWNILRRPQLCRQSPQTGAEGFVTPGCLAPLGLGWPQLGLSRLGATEGATAKSCILIWLDGGPSHLETWDPKPDAPQDVKGPFAARKTSVPGIHVCELFHHTAPLARHLAIVRSMTSPLGEHQLANHYLLTGYKPTPVLDYPSLGSVVAKTRAGACPS